jgi:hypothetical protein
MSNELQSSPATGKVNLDKYPRLAGVLFLVIALIFGFLGFYLPIQDAYQGALKITTHPKAIYASVIFTIMGCVLVVLGPIATRLANKFVALSGWKKKLVAVAALIPLLLAAFLVDHLFKEFLAGFGYKFKF